MRATPEETEQLRGSVRDFVASELTGAALRSAVDTGRYDAAVWQTLTGSLGLAGVGVPERFGGAGYSFAELGVVLEELGAALAPVPFLSTVTAAAAVLICGDDDARAGLLPDLACGADIGVPVLRAELVADVVDGRWMLTGTAAHVPDAPHADVFVVAASAPEGSALLAVRASAATVRPLAALDGTRPLAAVEFAGSPAQLLGTDGPDRARLQLAADVQLAAIACEQAGAAARCLDLTVDYAKTREQFGVPIGTFQAIKHRCADLLVEIEAARSIAYHARDGVADAYEGVVDGLHATVAAAASWCAETYVRAAQETIQLHGGIGFTWEHDAHLHLRRARADQLLYGTPRGHRRALADAMGI